MELHLTTGFDLPWDHTVAYVLPVSSVTHPALTPARVPVLDLPIYTGGMEG